MDFLKALFNGGALTYDQLLAAVTEAKLNVVNIADGSYIAKTKFDDKVATLNQQVKDLQDQVSQRDADLSNLNEQLTAAQADAGKLSEVQSSLTGLQSKYEADKQAWEHKNAQQAYEFMVRERANGLKFTSAAAKRDFVREATGKEFKVDGESLLGYDEFVTKYKADNPGAVVEDKPAEPPTQPTPTIVVPTSNPNPAAKKGLMAMMKAKNENPDMIVNFD